MISRRAFTAMVLTATLPCISLAQSYPTRPIKILVPFPPGGPIDTMARLLAQQLGETLGHPVVIENRPGAGGTIGARSVATSDPDGYTLLFGSTSTLAISPALYQNLGYDPNKSFAAIASFSDSPLVLVVHPSVNANTVQELIALAKNNPGKLSFASAGNGTPPHLTGELFKVSAGIDIVHVPYKGGAPAIQDVVGGQVQMTFEVMAVLVPFIKEGKLKALAVTSKQRSNLLSKVPTMIEAGLRDFQSNSWTGLVAPAGTPQAAISILNAAVNSALRTGQVLAILEKLGAQPIGGTPEQFAALLTDEIKKWAAIAVVAGAKNN